MRRSNQAPKRCRQIETYAVNVKIDGTTNAVSGMDAAIIESVTNPGAGNYQVNFKDKSPQDIICDGLVCFTDSRIGRVTASDQQSITFQFDDLAGAAADADFGFSALWLGTKHLF